MSKYCSNCGKAFENDYQNYCPNCGARREVPVPRPAMPVQADAKAVRAGSLRRQFDETAAPSGKKKKSVLFRLIVLALIVWGVVTAFPQVKTPFERVFKNKESVEVVARDTYYDLAGLAGFGDISALGVVKGTAVQDSALNLGEALERACSSSSWRVSKRDGKSAAIFNGTLKDSKDSVEIAYTVEGDHCSLFSFTMNGEAQTAQLLDALIAAAAK